MIESGEMAAGLMVPAALPLFISELILRGFLRYIERT